MRTVGAVAFWGQFEACVNCAFELPSGLWDERWVADVGGSIGLRYHGGKGVKKKMYLRTHHYKNVARY